MRGFTAVELLIACGLTLGLATMAAAFLTSTFRHSSATSARASLLSEGLVCVKWLETDLLRSESHLVLFEENLPVQSVLGMIGRAPLTPDGKVRYDEHLTIYRHLAGSRAFVRKEYPPEPPALGLAFDPAKPPLFEATQLLQAVAVVNGSERTLSHRVDTFRAQADGRLLAFSLTLSQQAGPNRTETVDLSRTVSFRF